MTFSLTVITECLDLDQYLKVGVALKYSAIVGYLRPPNVSMSVICSIFILANCHLWPKTIK